MHVFSTRALPRNAKLSYWNEVSSRMFTGLEVASADLEDFDGVMCTDHLGPITFIKVASAPVTVLRTERHIGRFSADHIQIQLALHGKFQVMQAGREAVLSRGDFNIADPTLPMHLRYGAPGSAIILSMPRAYLRRYIPFPERLVGRTMAYDQGLNRVAVGMIEMLWHQLRQGCPEAVGHNLADNLLGVIAAAYATSHGAAMTEPAASGWRRIEVQRFIEANLRDPELSPGSCALALKLSPRYMRDLFAAEGEPVSAYILRRRLEECGKSIAGGLSRGKSITDIAFEWGFNNPTHFSRVFKAHFGVSPRQYRGQY